MRSRVNTIEMGMKMKKLLVITMVFALGITMAGTLPVVEAAARVTIASMDYSYSGTSDAEMQNGAVTTDLNKSKYGSKKKGYAFTKGNARIYASVDGKSLRKLEWSAENKAVAKVYSMNGTKEASPVMTAGNKDISNKWTKGTKPYFEIQLSTKGYKNVYFSAYVAATKKGPRDYALSYAVGNSTSFKALSGQSAKISLSDNKKFTKISGILPSAADNQTLVKVRVEITSMRTVSTKDAGVYLYTNPAKGEAAINHITITGDKVSSSSTGSTAKNSSSNKKVSASSSKKKLTKLKLNKKKLTLKKGKTYKLKVTYKPNKKSIVKAAKKKIKWISSNKKVATVSKSGKIKAKRAGKATITVQYSKKIKSTCKVTVRKAS